MDIFVIPRQQGLQELFSLSRNLDHVDPSVMGIVGTFNQLLPNKAVNQSGDIGPADQHQLADLILFTGLGLAAA